MTRTMLSILRGETCVQYRYLADNFRHCVFEGIF